MRPADRHEKIVRLVHKAGEISVDELAQTLDASRETILRDLSNLDALGRLKKFHGGARVRSNPSVVEPSVEGPFALRMAENLTAKRRIAYAAARLLAPGDSVFLDTGTTTVILAEALVDLPALVVITNSWKIAATVSANADHKGLSTRRRLRGGRGGDARAVRSRAGAEVPGPPCLPHRRRDRWAFGHGFRRPRKWRRP